jgi:methylmalonyl-CoA mutase C-terminal domain/subunit
MTDNENRLDTAQPHEAPLRVLLGKLGLDGHTRGIQSVAGVLRDGGMEVIYTGLRRNSAQVAEIALQEDVDVIGLSFMSGSHLELTEDLFAMMKERNIADIPVVVGGVIPRNDVQTLLDLGVRAVFPTDSTGEEILACFRKVAHRGVV